MKKRVADIVFETLIELNIIDCFSVVGGGAMYLDNALALNNKMQSHFNHHEQACAMAAEAYARYSGRAAAVCVTSGPGATNTLTGVMGAWVDSVPMIVVSGNVRYETSIEKSGLPLRYRGLQEFNIIDSIKNMTKYSTVLLQPNDVKYEIQKSVHLAMSGRRGPVWIDIPQDIQNTIVDESELKEYKAAPELFHYAQEDCRGLLGKIKMAKRPCILIGSGIQTAHLEEAFEGILDTLRLPIVGGAWLGDVFYLEHPYYFGLSGNAGPRTGNFILQNSDFILVLGNSLSYKQTGYDLDSFAPNAKIVMVDVDENENYKVREMVDEFIHCDLAEFFRVFSQVSSSEIASPIEWLKYCNQVKSFFCAFVGKATARDDKRVKK